MDETQVPIIKVPDELIGTGKHRASHQSQSQASAEDAPKLYKLDETEFIVTMEVDGTVLRHRIRKPTLEALNEREQQLSEETVALGNGVSRYEGADLVTPDATLWNKFAIEVQGYDMNGEDPEQWVKLTPELVDEIPGEHKSDAILGLYRSIFEIERPASKGFKLGAVTYRVKQKRGDYVIYHVFKKHSEKARRDVARKSRETQYVTGEQVKTRYFGKLKAFVDFYDEYIDHLEGITGDDPNIAQRKDLVNALWKRAAVRALMEGFETSRSDLSKN